MRQNNRRLIMPIIMLLLAAAAGFSLYQFTQKQIANPTAALATTLPALKTPATLKGLIGAPRPDFTLPDLENKPRNIGEWGGKVVLINFWATWCPPCRREMPGFIELKEQYGPQGFEIVGIAIDTPDLVQDFADAIGVNYPILHGQMDATKISTEYGNHMGALPYSILIDRAGKIHSLRAGELAKPLLEEQLKTLL